MHLVGGNYFNKVVAPFCGTLFFAFLLLIILITDSNQLRTGKAIKQTIEHLHHDHDQFFIGEPVVIGILTEVLRDYERFTNKPSLFIASSYVKWIEAAGAQVLPILLNQNDTYYEQVVAQTNGLLFPGGDNPLEPKRKDALMLEAAKSLLKFAIHTNYRGRVYPIWATCLGMELLSVLASGENVLEHCSATDVELKLDFAERGRLFAPSSSSYDGLINQTDYARLVVEAMSNSNLTYNYHHKCLTEEAFHRAHLQLYYKPLAFSTDLNGLRFIAIIEAKEYPFYGVQFHPEKAPFEFQVRKHQTNILHSRKAIAISRYFADFFVSLASTNIAPGGAPDPELLIYSSQATYTALKDDMYEQRYLFPYPLYEDSLPEDDEHEDYGDGDEDDESEGDIYGDYNDTDSFDED